MALRDSFNYFFSSTPQVLGGILALFGVFVIFAVQTLRSELLNIAKIIYDNARNSSDSHLGSKIPGWDNNTHNISKKIDESIDSGNLYKIKVSIEYIEDFSFSVIIKSFVNSFNFLDTLIKRTFFFSIFTASTIVTCMIILALGKMLICYPILVFVLFSLVIICSGFCMYGLIFKILVPALGKTVYGD